MTKKFLPAILIFLLIIIASRASAFDIHKEYTYLQYNGPIKIVDESFKNPEKVCFKILTDVVLREVNVMVDVKSYEDFLKKSVKHNAYFDMGAGYSLGEEPLGFWRLYDFGEETIIDFPNNFTNVKKFGIIFYYRNDYGLQGCSLYEISKEGKREELIGNISSEDFNFKIRLKPYNCECPCEYDEWLCKKYRFYFKNNTIEFLDKDGTKFNVNILNKRAFFVEEEDDNIYYLDSVLIFLPPQEVESQKVERKFNLKLVILAFAFIILMFALLFLFKNKLSKKY
ncbi:MAG: hypothetical protein QXM38_02995 [Candidatus Aenigmatarchaeota archaeon]